MARDVSNRLPVVLALGSNLGNREDFLRAGLRRLLAGGEVWLQAVSSLFESDPVACDGGPFLNAVVAMRTDLEPFRLLAVAKEAEREAGRTGSRGDARTLDVDILFHGDTVLETPALTIPHPAVFDRPFILVPLLEVCGEEENPLTGQRIRDEAESALSRLGKRPSRTAGPEWWVED